MYTFFGYLGLCLLCACAAAVIGTNTWKEASKAVLFTVFGFPIAIGILSLFIYLMAQYGIINAIFWISIISYIFYLIFDSFIELVNGASDVLSDMFSS